MAKVHSEEDWFNNSQESRNPWSTSSSYIDLGSLGKVISLAERTNQLKGKADQDKIREKAKTTSSSIKLIEQLEKLAKLETELYKVKEMIYHYKLKEETKDLTDSIILDGKSRRMEELSLHFSAIVDKKDELINRLQQPFVGDHITVDAEYQRYVVDAIPCLANVLSNLTTYIENLEWSTKFTLQDGEMEKILADVSSVLAQMQSFFQSLCTSRNLMSKLNQK
ncbi:AUGMIN subunit 2-like [Dendronephthya gigantea]|uniref:AUGMIN subunit 2-like n=1 Tax=Dendronephthya gigantea TaxID=151771 RepID=UPI00106A25FC|nr:AUGMIN subunit 2-like [Dendronephthya gigantea]